MHPDFWHTRWQLGQIGFHQAEIHPWLEEFWPHLSIKAPCRVFVPLCGKSLDMLWLREHGYAVVGVELSPLAVEAFFEENRLSPRVSQQGDFQVYETEGLRVLCGDFFALTPEILGSVDGCYDRASLVALPEDMRFAYARLLSRLLPPAAEMLLVAFDYPQSQMPGPPFSVSEEEVLALYRQVAAIDRLATRDILAQEPRFREKGLTRLHEHAFRLRWEQSSS